MPLLFFGFLRNNQPFSPIYGLELVHFDIYSTFDSIEHLEFIHNESTTWNIVVEKFKNPLQTDTIYISKNKFNKKRIFSEVENIKALNREKSLVILLSDSMTYNDLIFVINIAKLNGLLVFQKDNFSLQIIHPDLRTINKGSSRPFFHDRLEGFETKNKYFERVIHYFESFNSDLKQFILELKKNGLIGKVIIIIGAYLVLLYLCFWNIKNGC